MYAVTMEEFEGNPDRTAVSIEPIELIRRVAEARDREALTRLFQLFAPRIKSMMLRLGADQAQAEDLTQEALLTVWRKAHLYSPEKGAASTWIFTIARNLRIDLVRRHSSKPWVDLDDVELASDAPLGSDTVEQSQIIARVAKAIEHLPVDQRKVVELSFVQDLAHSEIAERIGIPLGTVKSRLRLAYERLRPLLEDLH
jgi:RNA polymerase sigma-70 factor (ECF subfamily)